MINYFNLIRALQTDQYDEFTVKELEEEFNTEPDIDSTPVMLAPEVFNDRNSLGIMAYHVAAMHGNLIMVDEPPMMAHIPEPIPFPIKKIDIESLTEARIAIINPKNNRYQKQQDKYRSRNFKK